MVTCFVGRCGPRFELCHLNHKGERKWVLSITSKSQPRFYASMGHALVKLILRHQALGETVHMQDIRAMKTEMLKMAAAAEP